MEFVDNGQVEAGSDLADGKGDVASSDWLAAAVGMNALALGVHSLPWGPGEDSERATSSSGNTGARTEGGEGGEGGVAGGEETERLAGKMMGGSGSDGGSSTSSSSSSVSEGTGVVAAAAPQLMGMAGKAMEVAAPLLPLKEDGQIDRRR